MATVTKRSKKKQNAAKTSIASNGRLVPKGRIVRKRTKAKDPFGGFTCKPELWTPKQAAKQLEKNPSNRAPSEATVRRLLKAIEADEWDLNGETVKISTKGTLLDGQNRLAAIARSGKTLPIATCRNVKDDTQDSMDSGVRRTFTHVLQIMGEKHTSALASAVAYLFYLEKYGLKASHSLGSADRMTVKEGKKTLENNPGLRDSFRSGVVMATRSCLSQGQAAFLHYVFSNSQGEDLANDFFVELSHGADLKSNSPSLVLRNKLLRAKGTADPRHRLRPVEKLATTVKAWNAWINDTPINHNKALTWRSHGRLGKANDFPTIE